MHVHEEIERHLEEHRPRHAGLRHAERRVDVLRDAPRLRHLHAPLSDGPHQRDVVHVLQRAHVAEQLRPCAADADERNARALRIRHRGHDIGHARTCRHRAHAGPARHARVAVRGVACGLLVPNVDDADVLVETPVVDGLDVTSAQREEMRRSVTLERLRDQTTTVNERHELLLAKRGYGRRSMPRKPARTDLSAAPSELVYAATDASRRGSSVVAMFKVFSAPMIVVIVLSQIAGSTVAVVGMVASAIAAIWWWRRAPNLGGVVLRVERGELWVTSENRRMATRFPLAEVDVELDTKTIQKVQEGGSAIPAVRFIDATVGPELDVARIVVVGRSERLPLTDDSVPYMEATEWFGKIRVFLRKNGWVPGDERDDPASERDD